MGIFFVCGVHGVGKTTICKEAASRMGVPYFSASELIHKQDSLALGNTKSVKNLDHNQKMLITAVEFELNKHNYILIDGHTTLVTDAGVSRIPIDVFKALDIDCIAALYRSPEAISNFLFKRDNARPNLEALTEHQEAEISYAQYVAENLDVFFWLQKEPEPVQLQVLIASWLKREGEWDARRRRNAGKKVFRH